MKIKDILYGVISMSIYLELILASFFWGSNIVVMKILLEEIPFLLLATLRVFFSMAFLGIYMKYKKISFRDTTKWKTFCIGFLGIYFNFFLTFLGMNEVKGVDNAFMNALAPILTFLFSIILLKKKGHWYEYVSLVLSVFAFLLSIHFQIFSIQIGFFYLFLGLCLYMLSHVLMQKWQIHANFSFTFYQLLFGFMILFFHCYCIGQWQLDSLYRVSLFHWILFLVISGIGFAYIQYVYMKSVDKIGALKTSSFLSLNPIITYIESLLFLNESFDWIHFAGFVLIVVAIWLMNFINIRKKESNHF